LSSTATDIVGLQTQYRRCRYRHHAGDSAASFQVVPGADVVDLRVVVCLLYTATDMVVSQATDLVNALDHGGLSHTVLDQRRRGGPDLPLPRPATLCMRSAPSLTAVVSSFTRSMAPTSLPCPLLSASGSSVPTETCTGKMHWDELCSCPSEEGVARRAMKRTQRIWWMSAVTTASQLTVQDAPQSS
jgi:hypothetical protein